MTVNASNDVNHTQHSATALATVATPHATLTVGGAIVTTPVSGGGTASYAMTVVNTGPDPATNLVLVNQVSGNQSFTSATCTATGGATCPATVGVVTNVGTLPVGGQITLNVNALVNATANGAITDTITATADNSFSVNGNSAVAVGQAVSSVGNVTVVGSAPSTPVPSGGAASFAMTITNTGPGVVGPIQLVDTVGGNLTLQGITCSAAGGATCPSVPGPQMTVATLPVNGSLTFTVATTVQAGTQGSIINTLDAAVTGGTTGRVSGVAIGSAYSADLSVEAVSPSGPLTGGSTAAFTMVVTNNGPSTSQNVTLTNTLGAGATLGSISCIATAGATCPAAPTSPISVPSIPASGVLTFTVPFTVAASTSTPVTDTFTATAAGDGRTGNNSATGSVSVVAVDLTLSQSAPATVPFGTNAVFTAIVANQSRVAASDVAVSYALTGAAGTTATVGCTPSVGATCPTTLGSSMTVPSLPAGAYLTFTFTAPVPTTVAGSKTITNTVTISSPEDANPTGSPATTTTTAADPRNGTYTLYAANGHAYSMAINFDNASYTITGNGQTITKAFSADTSNGCNNCYTVTGGSPVAKFRTAVNLIVGGEDFGSGAVLPYIAGVTFGTTIEQLGALYGGPYNLVFQTFAANGTSTIAPATVRFSGNVMQVCTATSPVATPATCPASQLQSYTVTVDPTTFTYTATNTSGPGSFSFQLAQTGASTVLLGSNLVSGVGQSFYGLPDAAAIAGGSLEGASLDHNWVTMILTPNSYSYTGQLGGTDHATLSHISANSGPFSMLTGTLTNGSPVYVMQAYPVAIAFGVGTSGLLQVTVP